MSAEIPCIYGPVTTDTEIPCPSCGAKTLAWVGSTLYTDRRIKLLNVQRRKCTACLETGALLQKTQELAELATSMPECNAFRWDDDANRWAPATAQET